MKTFITILGILLTQNIFCINKIFIMPEFLELNPVKSPCEIDFRGTTSFTVTCVLIPSYVHYDRLLERKKIKDAMPLYANIFVKDIKLNTSQNNTFKIESISPKLTTLTKIVIELKIKKEIWMTSEKVTRIFTEMYERMRNIGTLYYNDPWDSNICQDLFDQEMSASIINKYNTNQDDDIKSNDFDDLQISLYHLILHHQGKIFNESLYSVQQLNMVENNYFKNDSLKCDTQKNNVAPSCAFIKHLFIKYKKSLTDIYFFLKQSKLRNSDDLEKRDDSFIREIKPPTDFNYRDLNKKTLSTIEQDDIDKMHFEIVSIKDPIFTKRAK